MTFIADLHYDNPTTIDYQLNTLRKVVDFALKKDDGILFILGDIFHNRNRLNVYTMNKVIDFFNEPASKSIKWHIITGNHDIYFDDRLDISTLRAIEHLDNVSIYKEVDIVNIGGYKVLTLSWIYKNGENGILKRVEELQDKCDFIAAHLETPGLRLTKNYTSNHGFELNTTKPIISGHYHIKQTYNNIIYVGSLNQENMNDFGEDKGFYTLQKGIDRVNINSFTFTSMLKEGITHLKMSIGTDADGKKISLNLSDGIDNTIDIIDTEKKIVSQIDKFLSSYIVSKINIEVKVSKASIKRVVEYVKNHDKVLKVNANFVRVEEKSDEEKVNILDDFSGKSVESMLIDSLDDDKKAKSMLIEMINEAKIELES